MVSYVAIVSHRSPRLPLGPFRGSTLNCRAGLVVPIALRIVPISVAMPRRCYVVRLVVLSVVNRIVLTSLLAAGQKQLLKRTLLIVQPRKSLVMFRIIQLVVVGLVGPRHSLLFIVYIYLGRAPVRPPLVRSGGTVVEDCSWQGPSYVLIESFCLRVLRRRTLSGLKLGLVFRILAYRRSYGNRSSWHSVLLKGCIRVSIAPSLRFV